MTSFRGHVLKLVAIDGRQFVDELVADRRLLPQVDDGHRRTNLPILRQKHCTENSLESLYAKSVTLLKTPSIYKKSFFRLQI